MGDDVHGLAAVRLMAEGGEDAPPYLSAQGLTKRFGQATVVDGVDFEVAASEFLCVLGPSGCGKTTLLRLIAGFETADSGRLSQAGRDITDLPPEARDYGIVFQSYALFPNRTVSGNVGFGLESIGTPKSQRETRVKELLALVGLEDHARKYPNQLSGGQQQRVALARAMALSPGLLLLDEPLSALDANVRAHLRDELRALQKRVGVTALMVTHDQQEALSIADRIIVMGRGRIEQAGTPAEVYERPANLFVAKFLGDMNALPVTRADGLSFEAGGLALTLAEAPTTSPKSPHLCIRPAGLVVGPAAKDAVNSLQARVTKVTFMGDLIRLALAPASGDSLEADMLRSAIPVLPRVGDLLDVALPPHHLMLLGDA